MDGLTVHADINTVSQAPPERPLRADARRNRENLIAAARTAFASDGGGVSLEQIARDAQVGIGTLYRNFPTRESLVEAVYGAELAELTTAAQVLLQTLPPEAALRAWVGRYAQFTTAKRGMMETLQASLSAGKLPRSVTRERITGAIAPLLAAGATEGSLRGDVSPDDVTSLLLGTFLATASGPPDRIRALLDLVVDALRPAAKGQ